MYITGQGSDAVSGGTKAQKLYARSRVGSAVNLSGADGVVLETCICN